MNCGFSHADFTGLSSILVWLTASMCININTILTYVTLATIGALSVAKRWEITIRTEWLQAKERGHQINCITTNFYELFLSVYSFCIVYWVCIVTHMPSSHVTAVFSHTTFFSRGPQLVSSMFVCGCYVHSLIVSFDPSISWVLCYITLSP